MRMHSSISLNLALARAFGVISKWSESFLKARSVLVSAVFWEIIVTTSVSKGSWLALTSSGKLRVSFRVDRTVCAHASVNVVPSPHH